jgi:hypothetical protein
LRVKFELSLSFPPHLDRLRNILQDASHEQFSPSTEAAAAATTTKAKIKPVAMVPRVLLVEDPIFIVVVAAAVVALLEGLLEVEEGENVGEVGRVGEYVEPLLGAVVGEWRWRGDPPAPFISNPAERKGGREPFSSFAVWPPPRRRRRRRRRLPAVKEDVGTKRGRERKNRVREREKGQPRIRKPQKPPFFGHFIKKYSFNFIVNLLFLFRFSSSMKIFSWPWIS